MCDECEEFYTDPRMLPCLHTFCLQCLEKILITQESHGSLQCPNIGCKERVTLPRNGVSGFPQDLHKAGKAEIERISKKVERVDEQCEACGQSDSRKAVAFCVNCNKYLCKSCKEQHSKRHGPAQHTVHCTGQRLPENSNQQVPCSLHKGSTLQFYCKQCKQLICQNCMVVQHSDHHQECGDVEEVTKEEMESLKACNMENRKVVSTLKTAIATCNKSINQVETRKAESDSAINDTLDQIRNEN